MSMKNNNNNNHKQNLVHISFSWYATPRRPIDHVVDQKNNVKEFAKEICYQFDQSVHYHTRFWAKNSATPLFSPLYHAYLHNRIVFRGFFFFFLETQNHVLDPPRCSKVPNFALNGLNSSKLALFWGKKKIRESLSLGGTRFT